MRALTPSQLVLPDDIVTPITRVTFLMLNPSDASAFKPDPTWSKCCEFARAWNANICEAVNLHAFRSSKPKFLWAQSIGKRGDNWENDAQILEACGGPCTRVIAAWGSDGDRDGRATQVRQLLHAAGITLHRLGVPLTDNGSPKHPLARGKHFIPLDTKAVVWNVDV